MALVGEIGGSDRVVNVGFMAVDGKLSAIDIFERAAKVFIEEHTHLFTAEADDEMGIIPDYEGQLFFVRGGNFAAEAIDRGGKELKSLFVDAVNESATAQDMPAALRRINALTAEVNEMLVSIGSSRIALKV